MCGICGFITNKKINIDQLILMNETMIHRGPDDHGEEIYSISDGRCLGLAQRRLSILDLSFLGHQPMHTNDGRITIIFNGEIYNYKDIKKELNQYSFKSTCDTEMIIAAYIKWGIDCVKKFNGMFAIAIYDRKDDTLYLVRDRMGKKPLYFYYNENDFVFASECKPLLQYPYFKKKLDKSVMGSYLYHQYINAPKTVFEYVYKLEPGSVLKYQKGKTIIYKYWDLKERYIENKKRGITHYEEAKTQLKDLLIDATKIRMIADVPVGAFLSGGYDSSLVSAIAQSLSKKPIHTFCIGFHKEDCNEAQYARKIADYLGTEHTELYIDDKEMYKLVESIPKYYDEPMADSSQIATMLVASLAKENVTVALSGDGGDELFCGYDYYSLIKKAQGFDGMGRIIYELCNLPGIRKTKVSERLPYYVRTIAKNRDLRYKTQFALTQYEWVITQLLQYETANIKYDETGYAASDWITKRMLLDQETYLPSDILCKVDRASMKYSLESRCPILDYRVIEYSYRMPIEYKTKYGNTKHILKNIAHEYIPKALLERPKAGFKVPLQDWLRSQLKDQLIAFSRKEYLRQQDIFNPIRMEFFIDSYLKNGDLGSGANYSNIVWAFFVFQQWYTRYIDL